jgi:hypothetical protein
MVQLLDAADGPVQFDFETIGKATSGGLARSFPLIRELALYAAASPMDQRKLHAAVENETNYHRDRRGCLASVPSLRARAAGTTVESSAVGFGDSERSASRRVTSRAGATRRGR